MWIHFLQLQAILMQTRTMTLYWNHAGWAIKRARDVIFKGQNELPAKATVDEDSPVIFGSKTDALAVLSLLGEDKKQPDDSYRFSIY
jgi:hypothetical protein